MTPATRPRPGALLCGALAACVRASICIAADLLDVTLIDVEVDVTGDLDARGCVLADAVVPAGFQCVRCEVRMVLPSPDIGGEDLRLLMALAERSSVLLQMLRGGTDVATDWHIDQEIAEVARCPNRSSSGRDGACPGEST